MRLQAVVSLACLASCAAAPGYTPTFSSAYSSASAPHDRSREPDPFDYGQYGAQSSPAAPQPQRSERPVWHVGQTLMQGYFGVSEFSKIEREGGGTADVDGDEGDLDEMPVIGGGAQHKLGGERFDYGLEGLLAFGGRANAAAFVAGGGGAAIAVDVDLLLFDLYGGPFVSTFLGDKLRLYASAGPLIQWALYDQSTAGIDADGTGFGFGTYARTGIEMMLPSRTLIGLGVRWSDSSIDLSGGLGDLDIEGVQLLFTVSRGL